MEIVKWFLYLISFMAIMSLALFFFQVGDTNNFKQRVNYEIERQGGLTEEAMEVLNDYSLEKYNGRYTIQSEQLNQKVEYGNVVDYTVIGDFEVAIFPLPNVRMEFNGSGVSQIR